MPAKTQARKPTQKPKEEVARFLNGTPARKYGLIGNLVDDPELRFTPSGHAVSNMRIAVNERVKNDETGEWEDSDPEFYTVVVWRQQAENAAESLRKGDRIVAIGDWQKREWRAKETEYTSEDELVAVWELQARELGPSLLFRTVNINQPANRGKSTTVDDPWESSPDDEIPF